MTYENPPSRHSLPPEAYQYTAPPQPGQPTEYRPGSDAGNVPLAHSTQHPVSKPSNIPRPDPSALHKCANTVAGFSILFGIFAVIGGILIATQSQTEGVGLYASATDHPYIALGIAVAAAGVFQMLIVLMLAFWAKLYAETVYARMNGFAA